MVVTWIAGGECRLNVKNKQTAVNPHYTETTIGLSNLSAIKDKSLGTTVQF